MVRRMTRSPRPRREGQVELKAGNHEITLEFFHGASDNLWKSCVLSWNRPAAPRPPCPKNRLFHRETASGGLQAGLKAEFSTSPAPPCPWPWAGRSSCDTATSSTRTSPASARDGAGAPRPGCHGVRPRALGPGDVPCARHEEILGAGADVQQSRDWIALIFLRPASPISGKRAASAVPRTMAGAGALPATVPKPAATAAASCARFGPAAATGARDPFDDRHGVAGVRGIAAGSPPGRRSKTTLPVCKWVPPPRRTRRSPRRDLATGAPACRPRTGRRSTSRSGFARRKSRRPRKMAASSSPSSSATKRDRTSPASIVVGGGDGDKPVGADWATGDYLYRQFTGMVAAPQARAGSNSASA